MSAPTLAPAEVREAARLNPFDRLADVLPPVLDGGVLLLDGTYPGESRDPRVPGALRHGDYMFEQDVWLRVLEVTPVAGGTAVRCGRGEGATLTVPAGRMAVVWPLSSVVEHASRGGAL